MTPEFKHVAKALPSNLPCRHIKASAVEWRHIAETVRTAGGRLLTLWGADDRDRDDHYRVYVAYLQTNGITVVEHEMEGGPNPTYPSLREFFPSALRMERATYDLFGVKSMEPDHRGWLRHSGWPESTFPLRRDFRGDTQFACVSEPYPFVQVEGDGVHEIPVGPVHAGIIEPGHFRFSIVGEKVLRLEQRLGYTHKGIEKRFEQLPPMQAHRLAGRVSGDSTVAFAWAYCMALESAAGQQISARSAWLRALMLERERVANHLGDLGALGNDASLSFGLAQFSRLREDWLRTSGEIFGHRLMMDFIVPGGVAKDIDRAAADRIGRQCDAVEREVKILRNIYDEHAGLQDRFITTGRVQPALAAQLGLTGLAG